MLRVKPDRRLIPHGAAGQKQGRLTPEDLRRPRFEAVNRWILHVDAIAHFRRGHRGAHRRRRPGHGVAAQINRRNSGFGNGNRIGESSSAGRHNLLLADELYASAGSARNRAKTSFESSRPRGVSATRSPSRKLSKPSSSISRTISSDRRTAESENSCRSAARLTPAFSRSPRN